MKRTEKAAVENNEVQVLKQQVEYLENEREELNERIDELLGEREIQLFKNGRYVNEIRMVYYDLLSMNVSIDNCKHVVKTVLETLTNRQIDRLPQKSVAATMMVEARLLPQMQASEAMLQGDCNVLHTDGTKLRFEELSSWQVTTESGSYSLGMEDMLSGSALCFFETFRDLLKEIADLLVPPGEQDVRIAELLGSIKAVMTDRHIVNCSFVEQLQEWRKEVLPLIIERYNELPDDEKDKVARMNHVFCGLKHVVHNLGTAADAAVKEWVKIAAVIDKHSGFVTKNSRIYDMLFEISKLCSVAHGDQRNGKAVAWSDYLSDIKKTNYIVSFLHHRFNIYFVLGGAVCYHRNDLKNFLKNTQDSENFLLTSIAADIENKIYLAGFRSLGIFNKLVSGPLFRLLEEEGHIFELNNVWLQLRILLEHCLKNSSVLLEGECFLPNGKVTKDDVYCELFKDSGDLELDALTQECLEMICCSCLVLVNRQLADQLPGGKFYLPSDDIVTETAICPRTNILSERDFAQMDRKVSQKPNISTISASGVIIFLNNKTYNLSNLSLRLLEWLHHILNCLKKEGIPQRRKELTTSIGLGCKRKLQHRLQQMRKQL